jgi:hypothetical protein
VIPRSYSIKKYVKDKLLIRKLNIFSTNLERVTLSKVTTLEIKVLKKIEIYDGLYNFLLCILIV